MADDYVPIAKVVSPQCSKSGGANMATRRNTILSAENLGVDCSVIDLVRPATSGGGPVFDNWLSRLEVGDRFIFRRRNVGNEEIGLQLAEVAFKYKTCTQLCDTLNEKTVRFIVDTAGFSALMKCEELLPKQEGTIHVLPDECDRTD